MNDHDHDRIARAGTEAQRNHRDAWFADFYGCLQDMGRLSDRRRLVLPR